jgi:outer membrane protein
MRVFIPEFSSRILCFPLLVILIISYPGVISAQGLKSAGEGYDRHHQLHASRSLSAPLTLNNQQPDGLIDNSAVTIEACIELALKHSPDHNISRQALRASFGDLLAAWGVFIPTVFATYGVGKSNTSFPLKDVISGTTSRISRINESGNATLGVGYTVFDGAKKYFGFRNAYYLRRSLRSALKNSELEIVDRVNAAYLDVLRQEKLLEASQEQAGQLVEQLRRAEARHRVGEVTKLDVLQAQIDLQNENLLTLEYENNLITAKMELDLIVGGSLGTDFGLADEFEIKQPLFDIDKLVAEALERHPQLDSLQMEIRQQQGNLWMGRLAYLPVLKTQLGYSRNESDITLTPNFQQGRNLSFSMSWDILDSFDRFKTNRYNQVNVNTLKYEMEKARLAMSQAVRTSYLELLRLYKRNLILAESKLLAKQSLELESRRYDIGSSSLIELRQARADYIQSEVDYINSIYDYYQSLSGLGRNVGRILPLK